MLSLRSPFEFYLLVHENVTDIYMFITIKNPLIKILLNENASLTELRLFKVNVFVTLLMTAWTVIT